ncbi:exocyst complex component EXO70B1-like [Vicia villosa]|uniref:exocyst complex component EXO70B1-like n=1 Tax=Vicia villosa TaxID=3911 RepID=UPI00273BC9F2|nr:exocyst complex component EXO70B1-like [Vicia villosa]
MTPMFIQIQRWMMHTKLWRFVGFASAIVGLLCYALSSSFNHLFGNWNFMKIFLYTVFSFIICLIILFARTWQHSSSLRFKAHSAFLVLTITSVYSFFSDKVMNGKPDAYSLISCVAFAVMSLSLSRQIQCGFEVDLMYFYLGCLIVQLMKIKLSLAVIGIGFSYSLIILRSSFLSVEEIGYSEPEDENSVVIEINSQKQLANTDIAGTMEQLKTCLNTLEKKTLNLVEMLLKHVNEYDDSELMLPSVNFMIDELPSELINQLHETAKLMASAGFEKEFANVYISCRRKCLEECLISKVFGSQKINIKNKHQRVKYVDNVIKRWITASEIALKILFPFEQRLCDDVFSGFTSSATRFKEVFHGATLQLLNLVDAVADGSPSIWRLFKMVAIFETLHYLIPKLQFCPDSMVNETAVTVQNRLGEAISDLFMKLNYLIFRVPAAKQVAPPDGRHHPMTVQIMSYVASACRSRRTLEPILQKYPKVNNRLVFNASFVEHVEWIMDTLRRKMTAKSKDYEDFALRYLYMMNNRRYIEATIKRWDLDTVFSDVWFAKFQAIFQEELEFYQRNSWNKVMEILKLDNIDCMAPNDNVTAELLKEKLKLFNKHFEETYRAQSTWSVYDKKLREEIIRSVGNRLLPVYGIFIGKFRDCLGIHANQYVEYGMFEIQDRLNNLFLESNIDESSEFR